MSKYGEAAYANFFKGYNCSQSVVLAFAKEMGMTEDTVLRLSAGFGGGMGRMREVCGAFSGAVLVLGTLYGSPDPRQKTALYTEVQLLAQRYRECNGRGSIVCRDLLGLQQAEGSPVASERTPEYYKKRPCPELVRLAADLMAEYIDEHPLPASKGE